MIARLQKFRVYRDFYVRRLLAGSTPRPEVYCELEGTSWEDFANIYPQPGDDHDYAFLISGRVLDVLVAERLAAFDAVRVWIDGGIGELPERDVLPQYYAVKVTQAINLSYREDIDRAEKIRYWIPDFSSYVGHPFVAVRPEGQIRQVLTIPRIAELAELHKWSNCRFDCFSGGGTYYEKQGRYKASRTFALANARYKEVFVDDAVVRQDLDAARRLPQGSLVTEVSEGARRLVENVPSIEEVMEMVEDSIAANQQKVVAGLSTFSRPSKTWDFPCKLDLPFQKDIPAIFTNKESSPDFPDNLTENILFLRNNFPVVWNSFATKINSLIEERGHPVPSTCVIDDMKFVFHEDGLVEKLAPWELEVVIKDVPKPFSARFRGLEMLGASLSA